MADLIVPNVNEGIVNALKMQASQHDISVEADNPSTSSDAPQAKIIS